MIKKLTSILLCVVLLVSVLPNVALAADTVTILTEAKSGVSYISKPLPGKMAEITYKIQLNGESAEASLFDWSVSPENQGVSVGENGNVKISGDTLLESFKLTATLKTDSTVTVTNTISIKSPLKYDFDTIKYPYDRQYRSDADGNVYMVANEASGDGRTDIAASDFLALTNGQSTFSFDFRIPAGTTNTYFIGESGWKTYVHLSHNASQNTFSLNLKNGNIDKFIATGLTYGTWHNLKIEFDYSQGVYTFYANNVTNDNVKNVAIPATTKSATTFKVKYNIDNVVAYSGFDYTPELNIPENSKTLLVPTVNNRTASVKFDAASDDSSTPITWSLDQSYSGVTINPQTGLITVANSASVGDVTVKASQGNQEKTATLTLTKFYEDFEGFSSGATPASPWSKGNFVIDGENTYLSDTGNATIRFNFPKSNSGNNIVLEADIGYINGTITLYALNSWKSLAVPTNFEAFNRNAWNRLKIVFDYKNSTYAIFVNDKLIANEKNADLATQTQFGFGRANIDNVTIYNVSNTAPEALDVKLPDVVAGDNAVLSYKYFDESGISENCTDIKWYISDSKDTGYSLIEDANGKEFATSNEMIGKYLKAVVTPAHIDEFDLSVTKTGASKEVICRVLDMSADVSSITVGGEAVDFGETNVINNNTNVEVTFNLKTALQTKKTFVVALAYYNDNELSELDCREIELDENTSSLTQTLNLTSGAGLYKIFAWDENANTPLIKVISFK